LLCLRPRFLPGRALKLTSRPYAISSLCSLSKTLLLLIQLRGSLLVVFQVFPSTVIKTKNQLRMQERKSPWCRLGTRSLGRGSRGPVQHKSMRSSKSPFATIFMLSRQGQSSIASHGVRVSSSAFEVYIKTLRDVNHTFDVGHAEGGLFMNR